jgi:two-component system, NtrC family, sensor histidine kinase PilS
MSSEEIGGLKKRVETLILFRALFVTLFLSSTYFFNVFEQFPANRAFAYLIIAFYSTSLGYFLLLNKIENLQAFAYIQLILDVFFEIVLIYLTGGIDSWFSYTLILTILSSSIVLNQKAGYIIATISSLLYGSLIVLQFHGVLPRITEYQEAGNYLYNIFIHISSFYLIAFLSGYLSSRLEKTKEKLAEKDLNLRNLEFFNLEVVESLPSGLLTTDMSGTVLLFNRSAERITGMKRDAVVGKGVELVLPFLHFPFAEGRTEELFAFNGVQKIVGMGISMFSGGDESTKGYIVIFQDLTEWKKLEADMKKKEKWAAIGELSSNIAHEIRNPLASLKSSIEILKEDTVPANYKNRLMDIALKEMDRLDRIIKDFLTYSRPVPPSYTRFNLHELLDETVDLLRNVDQHRDTIVIQKQYNGEVEVNADPQKMRQVFWNLGLNALEAMPEGGELTIATKHEDKNMVITFKDTGTGIEKPQIEKIFYPFFTTKDQGTGLGLAIAYRIMEEHGGAITVDSTPGTGTTFKVILRGINETT